MLRTFFEMSDLELDDKRVLIREDLNVPMKNGKITNDERIHRAIATIKAALEAPARVMIMSHLGRPEAGKFDSQYSLAPVAQRLSELLHQKVHLVKSWQEEVNVKLGEVVLFENVRFVKGEDENDLMLAKKMAQLCDVFVMDAFATAHRAQVSTEGVARYAPQVCAGPLMVQELEALSQVFNNPARPMVAIVGGSKVSTKIQLLDFLLDKVDLLIVGGGIANTFLKAAGVKIGQSLYEKSWVENTKKLLEKAKQKGVSIPLPQDVVVAKTMSQGAKSFVKNINEISDDESIFDVGVDTAASYESLLSEVGTIVWNGPVGVFELAPFENGTKALASAIAKSKAYSVAGGGDTLAAIDQFGVRKEISYISTGGGAFLTYLKGDLLPAIKVLQERFDEG